MWNRDSKGWSGIYVVSRKGGFAGSFENLKGWSGIYGVSNLAVRVFDPVRLTTVGGMSDALHKDRHAHKWFSVHSMQEADKFHHSFLPL